MRRVAKVHWSIPIGLFCLSGILFWLWWDIKFSSKDREQQVVLDKSIEAVAAAENAKYDRALTLWDELLKAKPGDADLLLNQAVTVLKWIDESSGRLSSGLVSDPNEQAKLRDELSAAFTKAESTIAEVAELPGSDGRTAFLQATFLEAQARQTQPPDDQPLREQAAKTLSLALAKNAAQPLLACKLDDLVQENAGEDPELAKLCADALYASWQLDPRNLYVLARAGDTLLKNQDPRLKELLLPSYELSKPMLSMMKSTVARMNPEELLTKASNAIDAGDWRQVQQARQWFNILKGTSGFRTDARLVKPDIMALLDTRFLNRFAESLKVRKSAEPKTVSYSSRTITDGAAVESGTTACWYDFDLDLDFDVAVARGKLLQLYTTKVEGTASENAIAAEMTQEMELPFEPLGMIAVDLYEVDNPARPRTALTVAEKVQSATSTPAPSSALSAEQISKAKRHDTYQELVMWGEAGMAIAGVQSPSESDQAAAPTLALIESVPGLSEIKDVVKVEPCDVEGDGDLDLIVACKSKLLILQNNGNRTFTDISEFSSLPESDFQTQGMFACDVDRDLDQDVLLVNGQEGVYWLENILHSQFRFRRLDGDAWRAVGSSVDVVASDLDGNSSWDVSTVGSKGITSVMTRTPAMGQWVGATVVRSQQAGSRIHFADLNNDTFLDRLLASEAGLKIAWGTGLGQVSGTEQLVAPGVVTSMAVVDADRDGALDILCIIDGKPVVLSPSQSLENDFVAARVRGINDGNGGGRNNHYAVGSTLELWNAGRMQARVVREPVTHFGIGKEQPKNLRVIFNNGLTQNVTQVTPDTLVEEIQELKGSCPFVYGWDGKQFQLITDLLWNAPLGLQFERGQVIPDRRWEYLMLPGELVQPKDGQYELRITEELWEVAYFDHLSLTAVDHPAEIEVFTNEKVGPPSIAEPTIFTAKEKVFPRVATDSAGRDCRQKLAEVDRDFVQAFDELICQGLAEPHFVELDFGKLDLEKPWRLFLNGWMHPADTSLNIGMSQNPERRGPEPPSLWVVDRDGQWVCAQPFMGFPGGKPKSIVVNLDGVFRSDDHRIRIATSQQLYWDQAFVSHDSDVANVRTTSLTLNAAELHYRGFGRLKPRTIHQPHDYDYQSVSREAKWSELQGPFTRFGDVRELLQEDDDRMVVMVSGDEFSAKFAMPDRPLPEGWRRDFILHSVGWDKDADLNTIFGDGSLPLPFKSMQSYPAPLEQAEAADEVLRRNADQLTRSRQLEFGL